MSEDKNIKIFIEKGLFLEDEKKRLLGLYVEYCCRALSLSQKYECYLVKSKEKHEIKTTAVCLYAERKIKIYVKNRLFSDVLRSIAHELSHLRQYENGESPSTNYLHFSSGMEDEANELAGKLLNAFSEVMGHESIYVEGFKIL
jgi:Zn-dependent peptidase ImmA (M78 family)